MRSLIVSHSSIRSPSLQKHSLLEADITVVGERVMTTKASALHYADAENEDIGGYKPCDPNIIKDRCAHLDAAYEGR